MFLCVVPNISEEHTASIFSGERTTADLYAEAVCPSENLAPTYMTTR
jgi:hypothetical protein